ncbi:MAG: 2-aminobenzoate-CoA ligase, partial [Burkholderiaceae bacterium]
MFPELAPSSHVDSFTRDHLPPAAQWPAFVFSRPEAIYPEQINAVAQWLDQAVARGHGDRPALIGHEQDQSFVWSYAQLLERVVQIG